MSFTTTTLAVFMETALGATGVALFGADPATSVALVDAVAELEAVLGVATADIGDDLKARIVARWLAWRAAMGEAVDRVNLKAGSAAIELGVSFDHIVLMLRDAEAAALRYDEVAVVLSGSSTASVSGMDTAGSPYQYVSCNEW